MSRSLETPTMTVFKRNERVGHVFARYRLGALNPQMRAVRTKAKGIISIDDDRSDDDRSDRAQTIAFTGKQVGLPDPLWPRVLLKRYSPPLGVAARLDELREFAAEDGVVWNKAAEKQLLLFMGRHGAIKPALGLDDNGDIKALWDADNGEQILLRFAGADTVGAVLICREPGGGMRVEPLRATLTSIGMLIKANALSYLLHG